MRGELVHSTRMTLAGRALCPSTREGVNPFYFARVPVPSLIFRGVWERFQRNSGLPSPLPLVPTLIKEVCDA